MKTIVSSAVWCGWNLARSSFGTYWLLSVKVSSFTWTSGPSKGCPFLDKLCIKQMYPLPILWQKAYDASLFWRYEISLLYSCVRKFVSKIQSNFMPIVHKTLYRYKDQSKTIDAITWTSRDDNSDDLILLLKIHTPPVLSLTLGRLRGTATFLIVRVVGKGTTVHRLVRRPPPTVPERVFRVGRWFVQCYVGGWMKFKKNNNLILQ